MNPQKICSVWRHPRIQLTWRPNERYFQRIWLSVLYLGKFLLCWLILWVVTLIFSAVMAVFPGRNASTPAPRRVGHRCVGPPFARRARHENFRRLGWLAIGAGIGLGGVQLLARRGPEWLLCLFTGRLTTAPPRPIVELACFCARVPLCVASVVVTHRESFLSTPIRPVQLRSVEEDGHFRSSVVRPVDRARGEASKEKRFKSTAPASVRSASVALSFFSYPVLLPSRSSLPSFWLDFLFPFFFTTPSFSFNVASSALMYSSSSPRRPLALETESFLFPEQCFVNVFRCIPQVLQCEEKELRRR